MEMIYCPNCGKQSGFKRTLGFGTLFMVVLTLGLWLLVIPMYPPRCINCGLPRNVAFWQNVERVGFFKAFTPSIVIGILVVVAIVLLLFVWTSKPRPEHQTDRAAFDTAHPSDQTCPIKKIHPGMMLEDVRSQLDGYVMDYRGSRQDEEVYYVTAGVCHAFLDFNSQDNGLDAIDYGEGFNKIEFRNHVSSPSPSPQDAGITDHSGGSAASPPPGAAKGYPVSEKIFVEAYVVANRGHDDLDEAQLTQLAHDEYRMGQNIDTQILLLGGGVLSTRGKRAIDYLDKLNHGTSQR